jgi:glycosyl transferase, family 25
VIPIYYINLASRPDRRKYMESQFASLGIDAERIEAVTRDQVPAHLLAEARLPNGKYRIGPSEMACSLSHFETWKRAFASGATACLVFEDDAVISKALPDLVAALGDTLPPGIDVLKLEKMNQTVRVGSRPVSVGAFEARRLMTTNYGMCGYIISREVADEVIAGLPLSSLQIDDLCLRPPWRDHVQPQRLSTASGAFGPAALFAGRQW